MSTALSSSRILISSAGCAHSQLTSWLRSAERSCERKKSNKRTENTQRFVRNQVQEADVLPRHGGDRPRQVSLRVLLPFSCSCHRIVKLPSNHKQPLREKRPHTSGHIDEEGVRSELAGSHSKWNRIQTFAIFTYEYMICIYSFVLLFKCIVRFILPYIVKVSHNAP